MSAKSTGLIFALLITVAAATAATLPALSGAVSSAIDGRVATSGGAGGNLVPLQ